MPSLRSNAAAASPATYSDFRTPIRWNRKIDRRIARALSGLAFLFALAACAASPPPAATRPPPPVAVTRAPEITVERLAPSPAVSAPLAPPVSAPPARPALKQTAALAPKPVDDNPKQLFGLSGQRVAALLGPANFVRRDGAAEVWQYRAPECVLDVFLYRKDSTLSVAHFDLRPRRAAIQVPRRCFAGLLTKQR
jgi:hypothetical protein